MHSIEDSPGGAGDSQDMLARHTLGRQIADRIRNEILFGRLPSGTRLAQQQLCERYGVSRMPVRDALKQLTYEGFLVTDGSHHSMVASWTRADIEDIYHIEGIVHGRATRRAVERITEEELALLEELHRGMVEAQAADDAPLMADLNWRFHRELNRQARAPKLTAALRSLSLNIPRTYVVEIPGWMARANAEHGRILAAIRNGDAVRAERLMTKHIAEAGFHLIDTLTERGFELPD